MEALEIVETVLKNRTPYEKVVYLLKTYKDLNSGKKINDEYRNVIGFIDKAINLIADDEYIDIIKCLYVDGLTYDETAELIQMDKRTLYRQRRRLIKRLAIIIYGESPFLCLKDDIKFYRLSKTCQKNVKNVSKMRP